MEEANAQVALELARVRAAPDDVHALTDFATAAIVHGYGDAAKNAIDRAVRLAPSDSRVLAVQAHILHDRGEWNDARTAYAHALALDPENPTLHEGAAYVARRLGEPGVARIHRDRAFRGRGVTASRDLGDGEKPLVALVLSADGGNTDFHRLFPELDVRVMKVVVEFFEPHTELPRFDLIINAMSDPDRLGCSLDRFASLFADQSCPVINSPHCIAATARELLPITLAGIEAVVVPNIAHIRATQSASELEKIEASGVGYPMMLRLPGYHTGEHAMIVRTRQECEPALAALPYFGGAGITRSLLASQFFDLRDASGYIRKYRAMVIDGELFPLHLAVAKTPIVHDRISITATSQKLLSEEERYITDIDEALGITVGDALRAIAERLALDYVGIDFAVLPDDGVLVFEANATMIMADAAADERARYRTAVIAAARKKLCTMVMRRLPPISAG